MSWFLFRQGTAADAPASESSIDGSTLVDGIRESDEDAAYGRLQPDIERDSPVFLAKVAEFQALLDCPDQTLLNIFKTAGFTPIEQQLLVSVPSPQVDLELYNLQSTNRRQYRLKLLHRGVHQDELPAVQLALCWFGAPFASLSLGADGDITTLNDVTVSNSLSQSGHRSDEDNGDSLAFLDEYDEYTNDLATAQADDISQYPKRFKGPSKTVRLRGGAVFTANTPSQNSVADSTLSTPTKSKTVRLYGFQGAVNFDVYDRQTFSDAVARLMGPAQTVIFAIYEVAPKAASNGKPQSTQPPDIYIAGKSYEYWNMRKVFCKDGAEGDYAIFVCGLGEEPPRSQWLPFDCDPKFAETVVYCSRSAESSSNYSDLHDEDEAYLRMPLNAEQLSPNQYFEWMFVVARILTPGAGLDALNLGEAGVVPRCLFSLHRDCGDGKPALFDPKTPGGVAFSPRAWNTLVSDVIELWSKKQVARAEFDVVPTVYDESRHMCSVHVSLFGATFETESVNAAAFLTQPPSDDEYNVRKGAPFRKELSDKVHKYLKDALTPEEHDQLDCVNLWANGRFWTGKPIVVTLDDFGSELKGFNDRWVVQSIHAYMHVIPSAFFIRPVFKAYEAIANDGGTDVSISFGSEVTLQQFRALLAVAEIRGLDPDTDHFLLRQTTDDHNMYPEVHPNLTETQRKHSNRPSFFISPDTDEDEWALVRSQIVSPTVWIDSAYASAAVLPNPVDPAVFGFCSGYGNMLDIKERFISDQSHDIPKEVSEQGVVYDSADVNHVADVEIEDAEGVEVENVHMEDVEEDELAGVLEGILQHATEIEKEAPITTIGEATSRSGGRSSSMVLLPLSSKDVEEGEKDEEDEAELGPEDPDSFKYPFMDTILLRISIPCPYSDSGCALVFGGDEPDGRCTVGDFIRHCEGHFGLEGGILFQQPTRSGVEMACAACSTMFGADATDTDKLRHLVNVHGLMYAVKRDNIAEVVDQEAPEEAVQEQAIATPQPQEQEPKADEQEQYAQSGLASPPDSARKPKTQNKRKRHSTPARQADPLYRPGSDAEDTENESSGSHSSNMTPARRAGRTAKRRRMAEKDSVFRPEEGADDSEEDDLANDVVPDSLESPVVKTTKTSTKKRKQNDPSYHPSTDMNFILGVVDELLGQSADDGVSGPKSKKKKIGPEDPSFRPSEPKTQLYVDDQDDELRRSAVPEWEQDPADPAGKRKRVIREKGAAVTAAVPKPPPTKPTATKPAKPARAPRAATPARSRAATPARSKAATPAKSKAATPAKSKVALLASSTDSVPEEAPEGRRRSGRSRQPPQKLRQ